MLLLTALLARPPVGAGGDALCAVAGCRRFPGDYFLLLLPDARNFCDCAISALKRCLPSAWSCLSACSHQHSRTDTCE